VSFSRSGRASTLSSLLFAVVLGTGFGPGNANAQDAPPLRLELQEESGGVGAVLGSLLHGRNLRRALESGLPVRLHLVTELWREGFFDNQEGRHEWRATVRFDPLSELYRVETEFGSAGTVGTLVEAERLLGETLVVPLRPLRRGRYYYLARLEVETLSLSDLEELRRWLQGDVGRTGERDEEIGSALLRGLRRLFVRGIGLPVERHQARTGRFDWEG